MKKIFFVFIAFVLLSWYVYASVTTARDNKSILPWQGVYSWNFDSAHNVWSSNVAQSRFSFVWGTSLWPTWVVKDSITGLYWESWFDWSDYKYSEAVAYCSWLTLGWFNNWRIPNIKELTSIIDFDKNEPLVDTTFFQFENDTYFMSSTFLPWSTTNYFTVQTFVWNLDPYWHVDFKFYLKCVRSDV